MYILIEYMFFVHVNQWQTNLVGVQQGFEQTWKLCRQKDRKKYISDVQ
jgi:hypothetical protein